MMHTLAVILARGGSKGLPNKALRPLCGRPVLAYTIDHARAAGLVDAVVLTSDAEAILDLARREGVLAVRRPAELATDTATVDAAVRHAVRWYERRHAPVDAVIILYGNVPIRAEGIIDRVVKHLHKTGCDSVRTLTPISKLHPDWLHRLDGDVMTQYRPNSIYRRQDLEPLYYHDGSVIAVTRASLFTRPAHPGDFHAFFGCDRRGIVQPHEHDTVDVDTLTDLYLAEAILRRRRDAPEATPGPVDEPAEALVPA